MSFLFFMKYNSNSMLLLSKYSFKFSLGCADPCNITNIFSEFANSDFRQSWHLEILILLFFLGYFY